MAGRLPHKEETMVRFHPRLVGPRGVKDAHNSTKVKDRFKSCRGRCVSVF